MKRRVLFDNNHSSATVDIPGTAAALLNGGGSLVGELLNCAVNQCEDADAQSISLAFGVTTDPPPNGTDTRLQALLSWGGRRGGVADARIDIHKGQRITIEASSTLLVRALYTGTLGPTVKVGVTATFGRAGSPMPVTCTDPIISQAPGTSGFKTIPQFAKSLYVVTDLTNLIPVPIEQGVITFFRDALGGTAFVSWAFDNAAEILIPAGANFYKVTNRTAGTVVYTPIFKLALG